MRSRGRIVVVLGTVAVLIIGSIIGVDKARDAWAVRCDAATEEVPPNAQPRLHYGSASELDLSALDDYSRAIAQALLKSVRRPGSGLGPLRSGMVVEHDGQPDHTIRVIGRDQDGLLLGMGGNSLPTGPRSPAGAVVQLKAGGVNWAREYDGTQYSVVRTPQGLAGLQQSPGGRTPQVASLSPDGKLQWCTKIGRYDARSDDAPVGMSLQPNGENLFVLRGPDTSWSDDYSDGSDETDQRPSLRAVNTADGKVRWEKQIDGLDGGGTVGSFGDLVLVSRWGETPESPARRADLAGFDSGVLRTGHGALQAFAAADGSARWTYQGPDSNNWAHVVIGVHNSTAVVLARRTPVVDYGPYNPSLNQNWLIGLGPDGREHWRQDLGNRIDFRETYGVRLFGDIIVSFERGADWTTQVLVGRDVKTGAVLWTTRTAAALSQQVTAAAGTTLFTRRHDGLATVDLKTGTIGDPLGDVMADLRRKFFGHSIEIDQLVADNDSVTMIAEGLVLSFDRPR